jgi:hypothetical protein
MKADIRTWFDSAPSPKLWEAVRMVMRDMRELRAEAEKYECNHPNKENPEECSDIDDCRRHWWLATTESLAALDRLMGAQR